MSLNNFPFDVDDLPNKPITSRVEKCPISGKGKSSVNRLLMG